MKKLITMLFLVLLLFVSAVPAHSAELKVRVIVAKANIRLEPTTQSTIISSAPLGATLKLIKKEANWYCVKLPPDQRGFEIIGYIHQSIVEVLEEKEASIDSKAVAKETRAPIPAEKKEEKPPVSTTKPEQIKEMSKDSDYLRWKAKYDEEEAAFLKWKKNAKAGMFTLLGAGVALPVIGVLVRENPLTPVLVVSGIGLVGAGLLLYSLSKRNSAKENMELLMNEGRIKKYFTAFVSPKDKLYAVSFSIVF